MMVIRIVDAGEAMGATILLNIKRGRKEHPNKILREVGLKEVPGLKKVPEGTPMYRFMGPAAPEIVAASGADLPPLAPIPHPSLAAEAGPAVPPLPPPPPPSYICGVSCNRCFGSIQAVRSHENFCGKNKYEVKCRWCGIRVRSKGAHTRHVKRCVYRKLAEAATVHQPNS